MHNQIGDKHMGTWAVRFVHEDAARHFVLLDGVEVYRPSYETQLDTFNTDGADVVPNVAGFQTRLNVKICTEIDFKPI